MRLSISTVGNIVGIQAQEIAKVAEKYAAMATSEIKVNLNIECIFLCNIIEAFSMTFLLM